MLKPKLLNTLAFLAHYYLFVTLESTLYALFATFLRNSLKIEALLEIRMVCRSFLWIFVLGYYLFI